MRHSIFVLLVLTAMIAQAQQHPAVSQPGYDPTVPRLISLRHKSMTFRNEPLKVGIPDIEQKRNKEDVSIYMVYEKESSVGSRTGDSELFNPPAKLMDLYVMYDYTYRMYWADKNNIDLSVPKINLPADGSVESVRVVNYFLDEKGSIKDKAIRKSAVNSSIENGILSFGLDKSQLKDKSMLEFRVQVKTRNFTELVPSLIESDNFERSITVSYPIIFNYSVPTAAEIKSSSASGFEFLRFHRVAKGGKGTIDKIQVESSVHTCIIGPGPRPELQFKLEALNITASADIGIMANDVVNVAH